MQISLLVRKVALKVNEMSRSITYAIAMIGMLALNFEAAATKANRISMTCPVPANLPHSQQMS